MEFLHIADVHIGAKNKLLSREKQELLKSERLSALRDFFAMAKTKAFPILICGDLFHSKSPEVKLVKNFFNMVEEYSLPVIYCKGNHDEKWQGEVPENFIVLDEQRPCISLGDVDVWCAISDKIIRENIDKTRKNILMIHGNIENPNDNDYFDIKPYLDLPFDYVAMGHIHTYKAFSFYGKNFVYSGSLFSNGFDECNEKGFVKVSISDKTSFEFCPLAGRYYRICEVDKTKSTCTRDIISEIKEAFLRENIDTKDLARVIIVGYFDEDEDKNLVMINNAFADQFYFEVSDKSKLRIDLEKLKQESLSFKAEFIRLVEDSDIPDEDKSAVCLVGIEALKGEDLSL